MNVQKKIVLLISFTLFPTGIRAQESGPNLSEDQPILEGQPISPPPTLNGQSPALAFQSEETRSNYLSGGISLTGAFTDNASLSSNHPVSDFSYVVLPHISFSQSTPRMNWEMSFGAGLRVDQQLRGENQFSMNLALNLTYRCSQHVNLRLSDTFTDTTGLFSAFNAGTSGSSIGMVEQSNNSLLVPLVQRTLANASLAELSYQFSPSSVAGLRGTLSILNYPGSSQNAQFGPLYNTQSYLGEAFYNRHMSPGQWVGVTLRMQRFETQPSISRTDVASLLFYYAIQLRPGVALSFFAGPEYYNTPLISETATANELLQGHQWTSAEGVTFNWQGVNTSVAAGFSRQLSDSGGLSSAVTLQSLSASLRHQLNSRQAVYLGFTHEVNDLLGSGYSLSGFTSLFRFEQRLSTNLILQVGYGRQRQELPVSQSMATANTAWVAASYTFSRPLGSSTTHRLPKYAGVWP